MSTMDKYEIDKEENENQNKENKLKPPYGWDRHAAGNDDEEAISGRKKCRNGPAYSRELCPLEHPEGWDPDDRSKK